MLEVPWYPRPWRRLSPGHIPTCLLQLPHLLPRSCLLGGLKGDEPCVPGLNKAEGGPVPVRNRAVKVGKGKLQEANYKLKGNRNQ